MLVVLAAHVTAIGCVGRRVRRAEASRRRSSPPRCGWCSRRCAAAGPLGGFPWADLGVALHDVPAARALAERRRHLAGQLRDRRRQRAGPATSSSRCVRHAAAGRGAGGGRPRRGRGGDRGRRPRPLRADDHRAPPRRDAPGRRRAAAARRADRPAAHREALRARRPACAATTTSSCSPSRRSTPIRRPTPRCGRGSPSSPRDHGAHVLVNARTPGSDDQSRNTNLLYTPDGKLQGVVLEAAPRAVRRVRALARRARASCPELRQVPYDFEPGDSRTMFHVAGHPLGVGDLLRVRVRAARARLRARRRAGDRGEHQQPLVPTLGQQRAAPRARPDARRGDRARRCCRRRCRASAR